jgi:hypothetical protein
MSSFTGANIPQRPKFEAGRSWRWWPDKLRHEKVRSSELLGSAASTHPDSYVMGGNGAMSSKALTSSCHESDIAEMWVNSYFECDSEGAGRMQNCGEGSKERKCIF